MNDRLGPSRIGEVLDPVILVGTLIATLGAAAWAVRQDPGADELVRTGWRLG